MLLEVKNLDVHHGKVEALRGVCMAVEEGEIVCLLGANGAGKTTLLRTISGLKKATTGEIWYRSQRINNHSTQKIVKSGVSYVEGTMIFPWMSVLDNLMLGAYLRNDKASIHRDLDNLFSLFPVLKERQRQLAGSLSGGERQMLTTARAMMSNPKLLLIDEPSLGLAPILVRQVGEMIKDINQRGVTIILVEQNAHMALEMSQRAYILETGSIVHAGKCEELVNIEEIKAAYLGC